jgi:glycerophosphoryl diester phosphodiesterase
LNIESDKKKHFMSFLSPVSSSPLSMSNSPLIIAHRGACLLAPENTLAAAELAADLNADGFETDIQISLDGVPFLMHDASLARTTDVKSHFPRQARQSAGRFTWRDLQRLDAGSWFYDSGPMDSSQIERPHYDGERIPRLAEALEVVRRRGLVFIFDLKPPPADHPYHWTFFDIIFKEIKAARIDEQVWYLAGARRAAWLSETAPSMRRVAGADGSRPPDPQALLKRGYQAVNIDLAVPGNAIAAYRQAGLWVNVYVVDDPAIASVLAADGANSITSNNVQELVPWAESTHPLTSG